MSLVYCAEVGRVHFTITVLVPAASMEPLLHATLVYEPLNLSNNVQTTALDECQQGCMCDATSNSIPNKQCAPRGHPRDNNLFSDVSSQRWMSVSRPCALDAPVKHAVLT